MTIIRRMEAQLDPTKQVQARRYARTQRLLSLVDLLVGFVYLLAWAFSGLGVRLKELMLTFTDQNWLLVAGTLLALSAGMALVNLPLGYYSSFVLPHRYGLSNQTLKGWITDQLKGLLISAPLGLLLVELLYLVLGAYPDTWWLWAAGIMLLVNVLLANLAPVLILPLFNKYTLLGEEHADLEARLLKLAESAGTQVKGVYKMDMSRRTSAANAGLTGLGSSRRIVLGDTLINEFSPDEIETVLAHELGHHVNRDIPLMIAFGTLETLLGFFLAGELLQAGVGVAGLAGPADPAAMPLLTLALGLYGMLTTPLDNLFSRWRERLADRYALAATGKGRAFASAMTRLANQNLAEVDPPAWVEFLFYSHPALGRRIEMANTLAPGEARA